MVSLLFQKLIFKNICASRFIGSKDCRRSLKQNPDELLVIKTGLRNLQLQNKMQ